MCACIGGGGGGPDEKLNKNTCNYILTILQSKTKL